MNGYFGVHGNFGELEHLLSPSTTRMILNLTQLYGSPTLPGCQELFSVFSRKHTLFQVAKPATLALTVFLYHLLGMKGFVIFLPFASVKCSPSFSVQFL